LRRRKTVLLTKYRLYLTAALTIGVALALAGPATAQSVEQRIEELQRVIEQQQAQIQAQAKMLEQLQGEVKSIAAAPAKDLPPKVARSGKPGVKLTVSGQVNRGVLFADDGAKTHTVHVDNDNSSTRVRFVGVGQMTEDFKVGAQVEVQFESNSTAAVNQFNERGVGPNNFTERKLEVYFDSKTFGRLWLGQGDTASNGTSEVDLSGVSVISKSAINELAGGFIFNRSGLPQPIVTDPTIGRSFSNLDGLSRDDRARYDTPKWNGFQLSTSAIANGRWDVAGRFAGKLADVKIAAAVAYWDRPTREGVNGSISAIHSSGINATFAAGNMDFTGPGNVGRFDSSFWYGKIGYLANFLTDWGKTGVAVDYFSGDDQGRNNDDGEAYGFFVVQHLDKVATELYAGVRVHDLDRPGVTFDDIVAALAGARIKF
jgi:hypothetical protein